MYFSVGDIIKVNRTLDGFYRDDERPNINENNHYKILEITDKKGNLYYNISDNSDFIFKINGDFKIGYYWSNMFLNIIELRKDKINKIKERIKNELFYSLPRW